jgi:hypothetical protein
VQIISTEEPQVVVSAKISQNGHCEERIKDKELWPNLIGNVPEKAINKYVLDLDVPDPGHPRGYGFGVVNPVNEIKISNGGLAAGDIDADGKIEFFRECTSNEGMHMTVWTGKPLIGKRIWYVYYHFPYDTESTCLKKDFE